MKSQIAGLIALALVAGSSVAQEVTVGPFTIVTPLQNGQVHVTILADSGMTVDGVCATDELNVRAVSVYDLATHKVLSATLCK